MIDEHRRRRLRIAEQIQAEWNTLRQEIGELPDVDVCFGKVEGLYRSLPWPTR